MGVIRRQFKDFDGQFSYAARRNRNFLTLAADQNLDARLENGIALVWCAFKISYQSFTN